MLDVASGATRSRSVPWLLECFHLVWILHSLLVVARRGRLVILSYTLILQVEAVGIKLLILSYTRIPLVLLSLGVFRILLIRYILVLRLHVCLMRSVVAIAKL
jgi:hypothetical protein